MRLARLLRIAAVLIATLAFAQPAAAQDKARLAWMTLHSPAMEGNLEGNAVERTALVVTPPGYDEHPDRRYPVVYFLHGYWATPQMYQDMMKFEEAVDAAAAAGNPVILVMPDGYSKLKGGFYSSGPTVGDYERFVAVDLVAWVDAHYRTLPKRESRGLSGHSMGGYGTLRIGMKYPEVFSSLYAMSSCCLSPQAMTPEAAKKIEAMSAEDIAKAGFGDLAQLSTLATWSPDPTRPPNFVDTGLRADGTIDPLVQARLAANSPLAMLPQYLPALRGMEAIGLEVGDKDFLFSDNMTMDAELNRFRILHSWETYDGDHGSKIKDRIRSRMLPFFGRYLDKE